MKKTVIITGANRGLGYETAQALADTHRSFPLVSNNVLLKANWLK